METRIEEISLRAIKSHEEALRIHSRVLACHCECLAMNAENCAAVCAGAVNPYNDMQYFEAMRKWELINGQRESLI